MDNRDLVRVSKNPSIIKMGAKAVSLNATSWAVTVVPTFAPNIIPTEFLKDSTPAFTRLMAITDVAELDWITAVTRAPIATPIMGTLVALDRERRKLSPEICSISLEKFSRPKMNRMIEVRPAIKMCK